MSRINRQWLLARRPNGPAVLEDFEFREQGVEQPELKEGEVQLHNMAFLCAPTMRNWMDPPGNSLYPSIPIGDPVMAPSAGRVTASAHPDYPVGSRIATISSWQDYEVLLPDERPTQVIPEGQTFLDALGIFGLNALAGYFGLLEVGQPEPGETVVVSGAAGSAGSVAAQIAKIKGCRVIGIAGGPDKCGWLVDHCGLDACIDYKRESVADRLKELCPDGINIFFDNVGGEVLQAVIENMAEFGRIVLCGQIASYNDGEAPEGPRNMMRLIYGGMRMQGFLMGHYADKFAEAVKELDAWEKQGLIKHREDIREGFDSLPRVFNALFEGKNKGTLIVQIDEKATETQ